MFDHDEQKEEENTDTDKINKLKATAIKDIDEFIIKIKEFKKLSLSLLLLTENENEYELYLDEVSKMVDTTFSRLFYTNKPKIQLLDKYLKSLEYIKNFINTTEINKNNLEEGYFSLGYDNN